MNRWLLPSLSLLILIGAGCSPQPATSTTTQPTDTLPPAIDDIPAEEIQSLISNYKSWEVLIDTPIAMSPSVAIYCMPFSRLRLPGDRTPEEVKPEGVANPHEQYYAYVYINPIGQEAKQDDIKTPPDFPEGTVIIKEKLTRKALETDGSPELLTIMVKKHKCYNPEVGDWWFGTADPDGTPTSGGKLDSCITCHKTQAQNAYVFTLNPERERTYGDQFLYEMLQEKQPPQETPN